MPQPYHHACLDEAIESHRVEIEGYLTVKLGCANTAQDLFQSIIEGFLRRPQTKSVGNLRAYLYQAARNALSNHYRAVESQSQLTRSMPAPAEVLSPEQILSSEQSLRRIMAALAELPLLTQQIVIMHRVQGIKQSKIAEHFDLHLSSVEKHLKRALLHCLQHSDRS
ncbi:MAG: RNA polymerase sigma factor [Pseudomonadota bacterium]